MADTPEEELERLLGLFEAANMHTLRVVTPTLELYLSREATNSHGAGAEARSAANAGIREEAAGAEAGGAAGTPVPLPDDPPDATAPGHLVRAPMVGTVYSSPEPGKPPFVEVGARAEAGDTVLLVETMKVFTSVTAGVAGVVEEIYVANGQGVEFDQPLLRIRPEAAPGAEPPEVNP